MQIKKLSLSKKDLIERIKDMNKKEKKRRFENISFGVGTLVIIGGVIILGINQKWGELGTSMIILGGIYLGIAVNNNLKDK